MKQTKQTPPLGEAGRGPEGSVSYERELISHLIMRADAHAFMEQTKDLEPEYFSNDLCRWMYEALSERVADGQPMDDALMLYTDLQQKGHTKVELTDVMEFFTQGRYLLDTAGYVLTLRDQYQRRQMRKTLSRLMKSVEDPTQTAEETMAQAITEVARMTEKAGVETHTMRDALQALMERVNRNFAGIHDAGFLTGISRLDQYGGLHPQDLVIIGAMSSHGKTSLALNIVNHAARESKVPVLIISMEMSALQLAARTVSPEMNVPSSVILYRGFKERGLEEFDRAVGRLEEVSTRIFIGDSTAQSLEGILGSIRLHHARHGIRLVMVDYAQIVSVSHRRDQTREEALAEVARSLKNIAIRLNLCVVLLSQVNRDGQSSSCYVPSSSQLRGSGQINEAADLTLMIYRPELIRGSQFPAPYENVPVHGHALLRIDKDRNGGYGGVGETVVTFDGRTTVFGEVKSEK